MPYLRLTRRLQQWATPIRSRSSRTARRASSRSATRPSRAQPHTDGRCAGRVAQRPEQRRGHRALRMRHRRGRRGQGARADARKHRRARRVGASSNNTGSAALGGDWTLEVTSGTLDKPIALSAYALAHFDRLLADASPTTTPVAPRQTTCCSATQFTFDVSFTNASTQVGYAPYVDLLVPSTGKDGNDGVTFVSACISARPSRPSRHIRCQRPRDASAREGRERQSARRQRRHLRPAPRRRTRRAGTAFRERVAGSAGHHGAGHGS